MLQESLEPRRLLTSCAGPCVGWTAPDDDVGNTIGDAEVLSLATGQSVVVGDSVGYVRDRDMFSVSLQAGQLLTVDVDARFDDSTGRSSDFPNANTYVNVWNSQGQLVTANDDGRANDEAAIVDGDSFVSFVAPNAGDYYFAVTTYVHRDDTGPFFDPQPVFISFNDGVSSSFPYTAEVAKGHMPAAAPTSRIYDYQGVAPPVRVTSTSSIVEGGQVGFQISLSDEYYRHATRTQSVDVWYQTRDWQAVAGQDYTATSGVLSFSPGVKTQTVFVDTLSDWRFEDNEYFLFDATLATGETAVAQALIIDDALNIPEISVSAPTVYEGNIAEFTVSVVGEPKTWLGSFDVQYSTDTYTASEFQDFVPESGTLTFQPYELEKKVSVEIPADWKFENEEYFFLEATSEFGQRFAALGTIKDDRGNIPTVSFVNSGPDSGPDAQQAQFFGTEDQAVPVRMQLDSPQQVPISVNYWTVHGGAGLGDFDSVSDVVTFQPGETLKTIHIDVHGDYFWEDTEKFFVQLRAPWGEYDEATVVIKDEVFPAVDVSSTYVVGGDTAVFQVTLAEAVDFETTVHYWTEEGSSDWFEHSSGSLTFLPGETSKVVEVLTYNINEGYEDDYGGYAYGEYGGEDGPGIGDFFFNAETLWGEFDRGQGTVANPGILDVVGVDYAQNDLFEVPHDFNVSHYYGQTGNLIGNVLSNDGFSFNARVELVAWDLYEGFELYPDGNIRFVPPTFDEQIKDFPDGFSFNFTYRTFLEEGGWAYADATITLVNEPPETVRDYLDFSRDDVHQLSNQSVLANDSDDYYDYYYDSGQLIAAATRRTNDEMLTAGIDHYSDDAFLSGRQRPLYFEAYRVFESGYFVYNGRELAELLDPEKHADLSYAAIDTIGSTASESIRLHQHENEQLTASDDVFNSDSGNGRWVSISSSVLNNDEGDGALFARPAPSVPGHSFLRAQLFRDGSFTFERADDNANRIFRYAIADSASAPVDFDGYVTQIGVFMTHPDALPHVATVRLDDWQNSDDWNYDALDDNGEEECYNCITGTAFSTWTHNESGQDIYPSDPMGDDDSVFVAWNDHEAESVDLIVDGLSVLHNDSIDSRRVSTVRLVTCSSQGYVNLKDDGSFTFSARPGFVGDFTFTYEVSNGLDTDTATVTIAVHGTDAYALYDSYGPDVLLYTEGQGARHYLGGLQFHNNKVGHFHCGIEQNRYGYSAPYIGTLNEDKFGHAEGNQLYVVADEANVYRQDFTGIYAVQRQTTDGDVVVPGAGWLFDPEDRSFEWTGAGIPDPIDFSLDSPAAMTGGSFSVYGSSVLHYESPGLNAIIALSSDSEGVRFASYNAETDTLYLPSGDQLNRLESTDAGWGSSSYYFGKQFVYTNDSESVYAYLVENEGVYFYEGELPIVEVDWGDGSTSQVAVGATAVLPTPGDWTTSTSFRGNPLWGGKLGTVARNFEVSPGFLPPDIPIIADHTYAAEDSSGYPISVSVPGTTLSFNQYDAVLNRGSVFGPKVAVVLAATMQAFGEDVVLANEDPVSQVIATFTDANLLDVASDYSATIDWGNGTSTGGIVGANGAFSVLGFRHLTPGVHSVNVRIHDKDGREVSAQSTVTSTQAAALVPTPTGGSRANTIVQGYQKNENVRVARIPVSVSGFLLEPSVVHYQISVDDSTAIAGVDFTGPTQGSLVFPHGALADTRFTETRYIEVPIIDDDEVELLEHIYITLSSETVAFPDGDDFSLTIGIRNNDLGPIGADEFVVPERTRLDVSAFHGLLANDGVDLNRDDLQVVPFEEMTDNGEIAVKADGSFTFLPADNFVGLETISYTVHDQEGNSEEGQLQIDVIPWIVNNAPYFVSEPIKTAYPESIYEYYPHALDPDRDFLSFSAPKIPSELLFDSNTGKLSWTPDLRDIGTTVYFDLVVSDGKGGSATQRVAIDVVADPQNRPPTFINDPIRTHQIAGELGRPLGNTNPSTIELQLGKGEVSTQPLDVSLLFAHPDFQAPTGPEDELSIIQEDDPLELARVLVGGGSTGLVVTGATLPESHLLTPPQLAPFQAAPYRAKIGEQISIPIFFESSNEFPFDDGAIGTSPIAGVIEQVPTQGTPILDLNGLQDFVTLENTQEIVDGSVVVVTSGESFIRVDTGWEDLFSPQVEGHYLFQVRIDQLDFIDTGASWLPVNRGRLYSTQQFVLTVGDPPEPPPEPGPPTTSGPIASTGIFVNNAGTYGLGDYGVILSTGDVQDFGTAADDKPGQYAEANLDPNGRDASGLYAEVVDHIGIELDYDQDVPWVYDRTNFSVEFELNPGMTHVSFDLVFGSEELPYWAYSQYMDAFGLFVDGQNISYVNNDSISIRHPQMVFQDGETCVDKDGAIDGDGNPVGCGTWNPDVDRLHPLFSGTRLTSVLSNDGIATLTFTARLDQQVYYADEHDAQGNLVHKAGDTKLDENGNPISMGTPVLASDGTPLLDQHGNPRVTHQLDFVLADVGDWHYDTTVYVSHLRGWGDQPKLLEIVVPENAPLRDLTGAVSAQLGEVAHFETEIIGGTQGYAFNAQVQDRITGQLIASIPISINNNYIYQAEAIDPDGDRLSYSGTVTGPKTMDGDGETVDVTIDQDTGLVDWLPLTVGEYDFVLRVEDGRGGSDELSYVLAVTLPTNSPPEFVSDPISVAKVGSYSYTVEAIDPDGDELTYSLVEPNDNSIVLADKTLSWSPSVFDRTDNGSSEPKHVVVQVSDGVDSQLQEFDLEVLQENRPPVFASLPIEDHVVATPLAVVPPLNPVTVNPESISLSYLNPVSSSEYVLVENIDPSVNANLPQGTLGQLQVHPLTGTDVANWQAIADTLNLGGGSGIELVNEAGNQLLSPRNYSPSISHSAATELIPDVAVASGQDVTFSFSLTDDDSEFRYKVSTATLGNAVGPVGIQLTNPDGSDGVFNIDERAALNGGGEFHVHLPFDTANDNQHHMVVVEALDSFGVMSRQYVIITIGTPALEKPLIDERFESANSTQTTAGIYVNDSEMLGLSRYGIVLSTGDVSRTGSVDPLPDWGSGDFRSPALQDWALGQNQNGLLSTITGTDSHFDVTQFDMNFKLAAGKTHLYFDVVFASSEQAEEVLAADGFGIFLDGVDVTTQSISLLDASIGSLHPNMVAVENVPQSSVLSPDGKVQSDGDYSISVALEVSDGTDPDMVHFLQFVIGDSLDGQWDSTVYISNLSSADEENQRFTLVSDNAEFEVDVDSGEDDGFYTIETGGIAQFIVDIPFISDAAAFNLMVQDDNGEVHGYLPVSTNNNYFYAPTIIDLDDDDIVVSLMGAPDGMEVDASGGVQWAEPVVGNYSFTIRATDDGGLYADQLVQLQVAERGADNQAPVIQSSAPDEILFPGQAFTYEVLAQDPDPTDQLRYYLSDSPPGMAIDQHTGAIVWNPGSEYIGQSFNPVVHVYDRRGGTDSQQFRVAVHRQIVSINQRPSIDSDPVSDAVAGIAYRYPVIASDPDDDQLSYELLLAPEGAMLVKDGNQSSTNVIGWHPDFSDVGDHGFVVRVLDEHGAASRIQSFVVSVVDLNDAPVITSDPTSEAVYIGREWMYDLESVDPNGDEVTYRLVNAPDGAEIVPKLDSNGNQVGSSLLWTSPQPQSLKTVGGVFNAHGYALVRLTADDGRGGVDRQGFYLPINENLPPVFLSVPSQLPASLTTAPDTTGVTVGDAFQYVISVGDPNHDPVTVEIVSAQTSLPTASIEQVDVDGDGVTETVLTTTWMPTQQDIGNVYSVRLRASDGQAFTEQAFSVQVVAQPDLSPYFTSTPTLPAKARVEWRYMVSAVDPNWTVGDAQPVFSLTTAPAGMTINGNVITWTPSISDTIAAVEIVATDAEGLTTTQSFDLPVSRLGIRNSPPLVTSIAKGPAIVGQVWEYDVVATDPDDDRLHYSFNNAPAGMQIDEATGKVKWVPAESGNYRVQVLVDDGFSLTSHGFELPVTTVNHPPQIMGVPWEPSIVGAPWRYELLAHDADSDSLQWSFEIVQGKVAHVADEPFDLEIIKEVDSVSGVTRSYLEWTPQVAQTYPAGEEEHFVKLTVRDGQGGEAFDEIGAGWDIKVPEDIYVRSTPTGSAFAGQTWQYQIDAALADDANFNNFTFQKVHNSSDLDINVSGTGLVSFTPTDSDVGSVTSLSVQIADNSAVDENGLPNACDPNNDDIASECLIYSLDVSTGHVPNANPVIESEPSDQALVGALWTYPIVVDDASGGLKFSIDEASFDAGFRFAGHADARVITPSTDVHQHSATLTWLPSAEVNNDASVATDLTFGGVSSTSTTSRGAIYTDTLIPVETSSDYTLTGMVRSGAEDGSNYDPNNRQYFGFNSYDVDGHVVQFYEVNKFAGAVDTRLTEELQPGDTIIHVEDVTGWQNGGSPYSRYLAHYENTDSQGNRYADYSYARDTNHRSSGYWDAGGIDYVNNTITLNFAWDGPTIPFGAAVRNATAGSTHNYPGLQNQSVGNEWTPVSGTISGVGVGQSQFRPGTAFIKPLVLTNYQAAGGPDNEVTWDNLRLSLIQDQSNGSVLDLHAASRASTQLVTLSVYDADLPDPYGELDNWIKKPGYGHTQQSFAVTTVDSVDPLAPVIHSLPPITGTIGQQRTHQIVATNLDGSLGEFTYAVSSSTTEINKSLVVDSNGLVTWAPSDLYNGPIVVSVTNPQGRTTTQQWHGSQVKRYRLNSPPVVTSRAPGPAVKDLDYRYQVVAEDLNRDALFYELFDAEGNPLNNGMTIDSDTGLIHWRPTEGNETGSEYLVRVTESHEDDTIPFSFDHKFRLRVLNNAPPVISETETIVFEIDAATPFTVDLTPSTGSDPTDNYGIDDSFIRDPNGDVVTVTLDPAGSPAGATINDGVITWPVTNADLGRHAFTVIATDPDGAQAVRTFDVQALIPGVNHSPTILSTPRPSIGAQINFLHQVVASDLDGDELRYELVLGNNPPTGMSIDAQSGLITWLPSLSDVSATPYDYTISVISWRDGAPNDAETIATSAEQLLVTESLLNTAPIITSAPMQSATIGYAYRYQATATDAEHDGLFWKVKRGPTGLKVDSNGLVSWDRELTNDDLGTHDVTISVADVYGLGSEQPFTITVRPSNLTPIIDGSLPTLWPTSTAFNATLSAHDPDEGVIEYRLLPDNSAIDAFPTGMVIDSSTGDITWSTPSAAADYQFVVRVTDDRYAHSSKAFTLRVYDPAINSPPAFTTDPVLVALVGQPYSHPLTASDPDGDTLQFGRSRGPLLPNGGQLQWSTEDTTPSAADIGDHDAAYFVNDGSLSVIQAFTLTVRDNHSPQIQAIGPRSVTKGQTFQWQVNATDQDVTDELVYEISVDGSNTPTTMPEIGLSGLIHWDTSDVIAQGYDFTVSVSDVFRGQTLSTTTSPLSIMVLPDTEAPAIDFLIDTPATVNSDVPVLIQFSDNVGVTSVSDVTLTKPDGTTINIVLDSSNTSTSAQGFITAAVTSFSADTVTAATPYSLSVTATDAAGESKTQSANVDVYPDGTPPDLLLQVSEGQIITAPTTLFASIIDTAPGSDQIGYRLTAQRADGNSDVIVIAQSDGLVPEINAVALGQFDPTVIDNGIYELRLTGWDADGNQASIRRNVEVDGSLKPGAFSLSNTDIEIPAPGMPINMTRVYSSLRADQDLDFGYGWSFEFGTPEAEIQYAAGPLIGNGGRAMLEGSRVVVTLPDGTKEGFTFKPFKKDIDAYGFGFTENYAPGFVPDDGNTAGLFVKQGFTLKKFDGGGEFVSVTGDASNNISYNPANPLFGGYFEVQLRDGTVYGIDATGRTGDTWVKDRNGNQITYSQNRIYHSSGREIRIERNDAGRITALVDQLNQRFEYGYDPTGNLISATDRTGNTTKFLYEDVDFPHHVTGVVNVLVESDGTVHERTALTNVYDDDGRLDTLADAADESQGLNFTNGLRVQQVLDGDGGIQSTVTYDTRGNVVRVEDAGGQVIIRRFNDDDRMTQETQVVGQLDSTANGETDDLVSVYKYNDKGELQQSTDSRGNSESAGYGDDGSLSGNTDSNGNHTSYEYDANGNIEYVLGTNSNSKFTYYPDGSIKEVFQAIDGEYQLAVTNEYNSFGDLTKSTGATGQVTEFVYDALGRQTETIRTVQDENNSNVTLRNVTVYDAEGRVETSYQETTDATGTTTKLGGTTVYNSLGEVDHMVDENGDRTDYVYDLRGLQIQSRSVSRGYDPLSTTPEEIHRVSRTLYDADGRSIVSVSFVESDSVANDNVTSDATYTQYDNQGRAVGSLGLSDVSIRIDGGFQNYESKLAIGGVLYDPAVHGTLESFFTAQNAVQWSTSTLYDGLGRVSVSTNRYGIQTHNTYNKFGDLTETRTQVPSNADLGFALAAGSSTWLVSRTVYDDKGRSFVSTNRFLLTVDAAGTEAVHSAVTGSYTHFDSQGRSFQSDQLSDVVVTVDADGSSALQPGSVVLSTSLTEYDSQGRTKRTVTDGLATNYLYDSQGRQFATIGPRIVASEVALGSLSAQIAPDQFVRIRTESLYDAQGRQWKTVGNLIVVEDSDGKFVQQIDSQQQWSESTFDEFGNVVRMTYNDGSFVVYRYNDDGQQIAESQQMDGGYLVDWSESDQSWVVTGWDADSNGHADAIHPADVIAQNDPIPTKLYQYSDDGHLASVSLPILQNDDGTTDRAVYQYGYNAAGSQDLIIDPLNQQTRFDFDDSGRQLSRVLPLGFGSDGVVGANDPADPVAEFGERFVYDDLGRQKLHISFEGVVTESVYDDVQTGRLVQRRFYESESAYNNGNGTASEHWAYTFDAFGRQVTATHTDATDGVTRVETNHYDDQGRLSAVESPEGIVSYGYDLQGRKTSTSVRSAGAALTDSPERLTTYGYDSLGRLNSVIEDATPTNTDDDTLDTAYAYTPAGSLGRTDLPGDVVETYTYDALGRLDVLSHYTGTVSNDALTASFDYDVRADGKRTRLEETIWFDVNANEVNDTGEVKTTTYDWAYDEIGRMTEEEIDHWDDAFDQTESFTYDLTGSRTQLQRDKGNDGVDQVITYDYDANDRLTSEVLDDLLDDNNDTTTTYTYDQTQQTSKTVSRTSTSDSITRQSFTYNLQGRMSTVVNDTFDSSGDLTARERTHYEFDSKSYRVKLVNENDTVVGGNATGNWTLDSSVEFLADHHNFTGYTQTIRETEYAAAGNVTKTTDYTFGHDEISQSVTENGTTTTHVFGHDGHGSVRILYDIAGAVARIAQAYTFSAYGEMLAVHGPDAIAVAITKRLSSLGYSGEHFDAKAQQQYLRARFYDPSNGRFNRLDPFAGNMQDPQSLHKYAYVHGDPVQLADPTGMYAGFGLGGMIAGLSAQSNVRAQSNASQGVAYARTTNQIRKVSKILRSIQNKIDKIQDTVDSFSSFSDLLELSSGDVDDLKKRFNVLSLLPNTRKQVTVKLPQKITRKLRSFVNIARKFGGLIKVQELLGEWGAALASNAVGLENVGFKTHPVHGIDQIRYSSAGGFWAIIEAKGGKSRLGSTIHSGKQMSPRWIRHWIDDTIRRNGRHQMRNELESLKRAPHPYALASVVRVNATGKRWELKLTVNKVKWNTPTLNWRGA